MPRLVELPEIALANCAGTVYVEKSVLFVNEETEEIQVDSFSLLDGMALERPQAGALLISAHACPVVPEGESLVNSSSAKCIAKRFVMLEA